MLTDDNGKDIPFVALNTYNSDGGVGSFRQGKNCGRFIKFQVGNGCSRGWNNVESFKICIQEDGCTLPVQQSIGRKGKPGCLALQDSS